MAWDPAWETLFEQTVLRSYPSEDLVRFVARRFYAVPDRRAVRILELGSGSGAHLWYLAREGFDAVGVDGSTSAVARARERLTAEGLEAEIRLGDIVDIAALFPPESFDAVVDVGALQCNTLTVAETVLAAAKQLTRPGGWIFADVIATGTTGEGQGRELEPGTFEDLAGTLFEGLGKQHFYTREELERLFGDLEELEINEWMRTIEHGTQMYRHWVVEGRRPG